MGSVLLMKVVSCLQLKIPISSPHHPVWSATTSVEAVNTAARIAKSVKGGQPSRELKRTAISRNTKMRMRGKTRIAVIMSRLH